MNPSGEDADQEAPAGSYRDYIAQSEKKRTNTNADKRKSPFDKVGLLTKLGGNVKNWLERGFALRSDYKLLHYFRSARDFKLYASDHTRYSNKIAGTINLVNARMFLATYISFENCLEISTAPPEKRHYYVYAKTAPELRAWINKLSAAGVTFVAPNCKLCEEELASLAPPPTGMAIYGMQGMIEKKGEELFGSTWSNSFKARFFRIEENPLGQQTLAYYSRYDDVKPKGSIALAGSRIVEQISEAAADESPECQWGIETPQRLFVLRSRSKPEKKVWIDVLRLIMENPNQPPPEVSIDMDLHMEDLSRVASETGGLPSVRVPSPPLVVGNAADGDSENEDETHRAHPHVSTTSNNPNAHSSSHISAHPNDDGDDVSVNGFENDANDQTMEDILHQTLAEQDEKHLPEEDEGPPPLVQLEAKTNPPAAKASLHSLGLSTAAAEQEKIEAKKQEEKEQEASKQLDESMKQLKDGISFMKFGRFGNPHRKLVFIADDRVYWSDTDTKKVDKSKSIYLVNMKEVTLGKETNVFKRDCAKDYSADVCFSLVDHERSLDLATDSKELRDKWVSAFSNARKIARSS